jgi:RNA polymerase sigma-54 factor
MADAGLHQHASLQQALAPQLQQGLKILQAAALDLGQIIQQEMMENPVLEQDSSDISLDAERDEAERDDEFDKEFAELAQLDDEWRDYWTQSKGVQGRRPDDDERRQFLFDSLVAPTTLSDHLLEQLHSDDLPADLVPIAEVIIGDLDERGFMQSPPRELASLLGISTARLEEARALVHLLHPVGVGATGLSECLLIQLRRLGHGRSLAAKIVEGHLQDLAKKRYAQIARALGCTPASVAAAADFISTLDPRPGQGFAALNNQYVTPDIFVAKEDGEWTITLNEEHLPRLRISSTYKEMMAQPESGREVRSYIRDKIRGGKFLIRSIHQRQDTIRRIAEQILERQKDFFEQGSAHLHPLNMATVAAALELHETTISRAIAGKYIATPHGLFELKYFFSSGYQTEAGDSVSNTSVKGIIADLVRNEDHFKPLSDQGIVAALEKRGLTIARRTVAKYRDELNILPSHLRKERTH